MRAKILLGAAVLGALSLPGQVKAGECYSDPIYEHDLRAKIVIGARVRDGACMEGTTILKTLPVGKVIQVIGETDGWYRVRDTDGVEGWVGARLMTLTDEAVTTTPAPAPAAVIKPAPSEPSGSVYYRATTTANIRSLPSLRGKIISRLKTGKIAALVQMGDGWIKIKTENGTIGWIAARLLKKTVAQANPEPAPAPAVIPTPELPKFSATQNDYRSITVSKYQGGTIPAGIDLNELNRYWITKVNALRAERGLRQLVLDQHWVDTASEYAHYMHTHQAFAHERDGGLSMHKWIDAKGLPFTVRYSALGWKTNYFTENISWGQADGTTAGVKAALDNTLDYYLGEASYNGAHYRTTYHADWNSVGVGFYFEDLGNGRYKVYQVFHYGSLQP